MDDRPPRLFPWPRVAVEGVVIVVSILLAFGIDAWWDGLRDATRAKTYTASILEDVNTNRERLAATRAEAERELGAAVQLADWLRGDGTSIEPDSVLTLLVASFAVARFWPSTQGYEQVVAAGDLGLLSVDLRSAMTAWNESVADLLDSEAQSREDRHQTVVPFLIEETSLRRAFSVSSERPDANFGESAFPAATEDLLGNRKLDNLLTYRVVFIQAQLTRLNEMRGVLDRVASILE